MDTVGAGFRYLALRWRLPVKGHRAYGVCGNSVPHCGCFYHTVSCLHNRVIFDFEELVLMARKNAAKNKSFTQFEFVRCELNADDKKRVPEFVKSYKNSYDDPLTEALQSGHKVSLSFNETNDSFIASMSGKPDECINANKCLTAHGKSPAMALWVVLYKHVELFQSGVWEGTADDEDFG